MSEIAQSVGYPRYINVQKEIVIVGRFPFELIKYLWNNMKVVLRIDLRCDHICITKQYPISQCQLLLNSFCVSDSDLKNIIDSKIIGDEHFPRYFRNKGSIEYFRKPHRKT